MASSETVRDLPAVIETPLSEPLFVLGTLFVLLVFFLPGGIAGIGPARPTARAATARADREPGRSRGGVVDEART